MVQDRKEPTLNTIAPDRDEILSHQTRTGAKRPPGAQRPGVSRPALKSSPLGGFAFIVAVAAMAAAGFSGWQLYDTQKNPPISSARRPERMRSFGKLSSVTLCRHTRPAPGRYSRKGGRRKFPTA